MGRTRDFSIGLIDLATCQTLSDTIPCMIADAKTVRAADHLIHQLQQQGVTHIFGVPGESFLPVLDALHGEASAIEFITCRQEGGAAMAADAHGKLTGRPGICMVTRGPGATNASAGVHIAYQDSTPMVLFIGQVARNMMEREAFQEIDYRRMFFPMAKWVAQIDDASRIQEYVTRAFRVAMSGRPGPVVLALPEDMLYDEVTPAPAARFIAAPAMLPAVDAMQALQQQLNHAQRPLIIAGGSVWSQAGANALTLFAQQQGIPVAASFRCQRIMNNDHENYVGHCSVGRTPYLDDAIRQSDLLISIGSRLGEITSAAYTLLSSPVPAQNLVHVYPAGEELGHVFEPAIAIAADVNSFCLTAANWQPLEGAASKAARVSALRAEFETFGSVEAVPGDPIAGMFQHLTEQLPHDAIVCNGAGNYAGWLHRFYRFRHLESQLAPTSGSMGYGLPAAVAAAVTRPGREVFAIAGDGCFLMTAQEMATAMHHQLSVTVIIVNNARYGTIRAHQEREYPHRTSGTELTNPDFTVFAQAFGAGVASVATVEEFTAALSAARSAGGIQLIEVQQDRDVLAPGKRLPATV